MHTGQLGQGQSSRYQKAPVAVSSLDSKGITKIVAGGCLFVALCVDSGAVLTHDVCVWMWACRRALLVRHFTRRRCVLLGIRLGGPGTAACATSRVVVCVSDISAMWPVRVCCPQLGHGDEASVAIPKFIQALDGVPVSDAACGSAHTLLKTADGKLMAFGRGRNGQLGRGDTLESVAAYRTTPQPLHVRAAAAAALATPELTDRWSVRGQFFEGRTIRSVACGGNHSLAIVDADA